MDRRKIMKMNRGGGKLERVGREITEEIKRQRGRNEEKTRKKEN